jgi:hypothetical protein
MSYRTVAQAMVTGFPNSAHKGHHSYKACVAEWQRHCLLGVHPHPVASRLPSKSASTPQKEVAASSITTVSSISPISSVAMGISTMSMTERGSTPHLNAHPSPRYYAISGGGQVYSTKYVIPLVLYMELIHLGTLQSSPSIGMSRMERSQICCRWKTSMLRWCLRRATCNRYIFYCFAQKKKKLSACVVNEQYEKGPAGAVPE